MAMLSHRQGWAWALVLALFPGVFFASSTSDSDPPTYHTSTSEVRVSFFATDDHDRLIEHLDKDDFAVVDSGMVIRDFRSLTRSNETALDILLLVDASESVAGRFPAVRDDVLHLISRQDMVPSTNISLVTFAGLEPSVLCSRDCTTAAPRQRLLAIDGAGATPMFDALLYSASIISKRRSPDIRPVLILFSDGGDTISRTSAREALDAVISSGAVLYAVRLQPSTQTSNASDCLESMAEATGGRSFSLQSGAVNILERILADQRASYVVTYPLPSRVAGFHSLRILPQHNLNLRFHCRRGYNYEEVR